MLQTIFDRVACVNLDRRQDRWTEFLARLPKDWPFIDPQRYQAVDGKLCQHPQWWHAGGGAWGCYRTHLRILEECLNNRIESCLFLEDDAFCVESFVEKAGRFFADLPSDWGMVYLGGQHLKVPSNPPLRISDHVYRPYNVNRTHAYGIRGREMMIRVYKHLTTTEWQRSHHIDHHLGRLHQQRTDPIYTPWEWLMGQMEGKSNVSNKAVPDRIWAPADNTANNQGKPFVLVLGTHSSGSSCVAMVLHCLGVHMGNNLGGYHGGEAKGLADICEWACPFPSIEPSKPNQKIRKRLSHWINARRREAAERRKIAGGKYPHLCLFAEVIEQIVCPQNLRIVNCERSIEESVASLQRRVAGKFSDQQIDRLQRHLHDIKGAFLESRDHIDLDYSSTLADPSGTVERLCGFLGISPSVEQIADALNIIQPGKRHVEFANA